MPIYQKNSLTTTYVLGQPFEVTVDFWCDLWVEKNCPFPLCVISCPDLVFYNKSGVLFEKTEFLPIFQKTAKVLSSHKSHQKSTVTSKGCPSGHSRLPYSLVFLTKGQEDFPTYSLTPKYTTDKDRRLCDLCEEKTFSSRRFLENRQKLRFFQKEPLFVITTKSAH